MWFSANWAGRRLGWLVIEEEVKPISGSIRTSQERGNHKHCEPFYSPSSGNRGR